LLNALFDLRWLRFKSNQQVLRSLNNQIRVVNLSASLHNLDNGGFDLVAPVIFDFTLDAEIVLLFDILRY